MTCKAVHFISVCSLSYNEVSLVQWITYCLIFLVAIAPDDRPIKPMTDQSAYDPVAGTSNGWNRTDNDVFNTVSIPGLFCALLWNNNVRTFVLCDILLRFVSTIIHRHTIQQYSNLTNPVYFIVSSDACFISSSMICLLEVLFNVFILQQVTKPNNHVHSFLLSDACFT